MAKRTASGVCVLFALPVSTGPSHTSPLAGGARPAVRMRRRHGRDRHGCPGCPCLRVGALPLRLKSRFKSRAVCREQMGKPKTGSLFRVSVFAC